jgi:hypothetical protein
VSDLLPADYVAAAMARDERLRHVAASIDIEAALRDGAAFRLVIEALKEDARDAGEQLVDCNPSDVGSIAAFQAQVRQARMIRLTLERILQRGTEAEVSLQEDLRADG